MNKEQLQLLRDANVEPTDEVIAEGLGLASSVYTKFVEGLENYKISLMDWKYYNDGKAWLSKGEYKWVTARGTNKIKPLFWLSIWEGFFKIAFFFSTETRAELLNLPISKEAEELIKNAEPMGKTMKNIPIIFDISSHKQIEDVYILAKFKKENT